MKKILFIKLIVLISALNVWPQGYQSVFDKDTTMWYQAREAIDRIDHIEIKALSDTIINAKDYKKLDVKGILDDSKFFLREDTTLGKVWIYDLENHMEFLTMDLSLNKGDTFRIRNIIYEGQDSVAIVDSVYNIDNKKHIRLDYGIQIHNTKDKLTFIEGIGPNAGLIYQLSTLDDNNPYSQVLLCVYKDTIRVYRDEKYSNENCAFNGNVSINNTLPVDDFSVYPNPVFDFFCFSNPFNTHGILEIYNIKGMLLKTYNIEASSQTIINTSAYQKGLYILLFKDNEILISKKKIIKY